MWDTISTVLRSQGSTAGALTMTPKETRNCQMKVIVTPAYNLIRNKKWLLLLLDFRKLPFSQSTCM